MDLEKIQAYNEDIRRRKVEEEDRDKIVGSVRDLGYTQLKSTAAQLRTLQNQAVTIKNPGASSEDVKELTDVVADLTIASHVNQSKTVRQLEDLNDLIKELPRSYPEMPAFPEIPVPPDAVSVTNLGEVTEWLGKVVEAVAKLKLDPTIEVKAPEVNVAAPVVNAPDLDPLLKAVKALDIKAPVVNVPDTSKSFQALSKAVGEVKRAIESLSFPVPNYVLPFKDSSGKAVQLLVDGNGSITSASAALTLRYDETTSATYTYIGDATPGTATSAATWRIKRMTNADTTIIWADGNSNFDNVWDNRASLTYS